MTEEELLQQLLSIKRGRNDLLSYTTQVSEWYKPAAWHKHLAAQLMGFYRLCVAGESPRYIIEAPPRHGKTELTSKHFPAWALGNQPTWEVIFATYAQDLASENGRKVRNLFDEPKHKRFFPQVMLADDSAAKHQFIVKSAAGGKEGAAKFTGLEGGLTGRGANMLLIDDPIKGREEADSEVMRRKLHRWYDDVAQTRIMNGGGILIMATRWGEMDLTGYVLSQYAGESWHVVKLPAICEAANDPLGREIGDPLWPESVPLKRLEQIRDNSPPRTWASLYQQRPIVDSGAYFDTEKIKWYDVAPKNLVIIGATDGATSVEKGDFTEHGVIGIDALNNWYVLDWWSGKTSPDVWVESFVDLLEKWSPALWLDESGVIKNAVAPFRERVMRERRIGCRMESLPSLAGKEARADGLRGMVSMGWLHMPRNKPWAKKIVDQMIRFPGGVYDDCVDVLTLAARGQTQFGKAILPPTRAAALPTPPPNTVYVADLERTEEKPRSRFK